MDWQPIETAPKGTIDEIVTILGYSPEWGVETFFWAEDDGIWRVGPRGEHCFERREWPTHWMPLPEPPRLKDTDTRG